MLKVRLLMAVFFLLFFVQCKKDEEDKYRESFINIGQKANMQVRVYDTLVQGYAQSEFYQQVFHLDTDNDGVNDLGFVSETSFANGVGYLNSSHVLSLHANAELCGSTHLDTIFMHRDTVVYDLTVYYIYRIGCGRRHQNDSVIRISGPFKVDAFLEDAYLSQSDRFQMDTVYLAQNGFGYMPNYLYNHGDTTFWETTVVENNCNSIENEDTVYIGFRLQERLGWIKIRIEDDYKIHVFESAVQSY